MKMSQGFRLCVFILMTSLSGLSEALNCSQCNMRLRGIHNTCQSPRNMTNCIGCMKTLTKVKLHDSGYMDGWERLSVVTSRFCMKKGAFNVKPEGCYKQMNNGGYTERCYCYSDYCNSGAARPTLGFISSLLSSLSSSTLSFATAAVVVIMVLVSGHSSEH